MKKLSPSILSCDFYRLGEEIENAIQCGADWLHIDVMDYHFVPQLTFGAKIVADIKKHKDIFCDVHLMVTNPQDHIEDFVKANADLINFHIEVAYHGDRLIQLIKSHHKLAGITLNPTTPVSLAKHYLPMVDLVLIMSVNPGFSGQKCIEWTFDKIAELKELKEKNNYKYLIQIDGGIGLNNVEKVLELGADVIVAGSAFFSKSNDEKKKLANIIHNFN